MFIPILEQQKFSVHLYVESGVFHALRFNLDVSNLGGLFHRDKYAERAFITSKFWRLCYESRFAISSVWHGNEAARASTRAAYFNLQLTRRPPVGPRD